MHIVDLLREGLTGLVLSKMKVIVQLSPPRSGSTLVYNILKELFPSRRVLKVHKYKSRYSGLPMVVTYRHPLDCIASSIQRYGKDPTDSVIQEQVAEFERNGIWHLLKLKNHQKVLLLKYEDFFNNLDYIYDSLQRFFGMDISVEKRVMISDKYGIESVEKHISKYDKFAEYDPKTHWHGKHISQYKGKPFYYREFFEQDQIKYLQKVYEKFLKEFDYT